MSDEERYWGDVLQSFSNGLQTDLRVKLAIEFLKSDVVPGTMVIPDGAGGRIQTTADAARKVTYALDLATELLSQAEERGLTKPLPDDDGLNRATRQHIRRNVRAQVVQQIYGQQIAQEESPVVDTRAPVSVVPPRRQ